MIKKSKKAGFEGYTTAIVAAIILGAAARFIFAATSISSPQAGWCLNGGTPVTVTWSSDDAGYDHAFVAYDDGTGHPNFDGSGSGGGVISQSAKSPISWTVPRLTVSNYSVFVDSHDGSDNSLSTAKSDTFNIDSAGPTMPGLSAQALDSSRINVHWTQANDPGCMGLTGYKLYRDGSLISTTTDTSYVDTGLAAASTHTYKVQAYDTYAVAESAPVQATTSPGPTLPPASPGPPPPSPTPQPKPSAPKPSSSPPPPSSSISIPFLSPPPAPSAPVVTPPGSPPPVISVTKAKPTIPRTLLLYGMAALLAAGAVAGGVFWFIKHRPRPIDVAELARQRQAAHKAEQAAVKTGGVTLPKAAEPGPTAAAAVIQPAKVENHGSSEVPVKPEPAKEPASVTAASLVKEPAVAAEPPATKPVQPAAVVTAPAAPVTAPEAKPAPVPPKPSSPPEPKIATPAPAQPPVTPASAAQPAHLNAPIESQPQSTVVNHTQPLISAPTPTPASPPPSAGLVPPQPIPPEADAESDNPPPENIM